MYFYEVYVASQRYHGSGPLTYSAQEILSPGQLVEVPLGRIKAPAIVVSSVNKPSFKTKEILRTHSATPLPIPLLELHKWMHEYYPAPLGFITQLFVPSNITTTSKLKPTSKSTAEPQTPPPLNPEQNTVVSSIMSAPGSYLLHGETGSGKTRVYVEIASSSLQSGKSVIILTPEIGLTPQLTKTLEEYFPDKVVTVHSTQTPAQRRDSWNAILNSTGPLVIAGPRSALFSPLSNVGAVIIDESHDAAYKQDQMPYYDAVKTAAKLASLHGATLILGSATPSVHDYYAFSNKQLPILRMEASAAGDSKVEATVIDLNERQQFSKSPWLSNNLLKEVDTTIQEGLQSLIFLNRRGSARIVRCEACTWQAVCSRCDLPLTYHNDTHHLRCHTCGYTAPTNVSCPNCGKPEIKYTSIGTKTIVNELQKHFPEARIVRFDSDNTKTDNLASQYEKLLNGEADIIVGTQMISKGLDLPLLRSIGVVMADTGLYFPDYTAEERTFQMLRQIIGRVGRGHRDGRIIIQTYQPKSVVINASVNKDYAQFYDSQIIERQRFGFPPFYFVLKIQVSRATYASAEKAANQIEASLRTSGLKIEIIGPAPSFTGRTHDKFHWQIIVKAKQRDQLTKAIPLLPKTCSYDIDPSNLL